MFAPYEDPVVKRKHQAQQELLKKAGGSIGNYSRTVKEDANKLRNKYPGKFPKATESIKVG